VSPDCDPVAGLRQPEVPAACDEGLGNVERFFHLATEGDGFLEDTELLATPDVSLQATTSPFNTKSVVNTILPGGLLSRNGPTAMLLIPIPLTYWIMLANAGAIW
jgi:hypothetical protein